MRSVSDPSATPSWYNPPVTRREPSDAEWELIEPFLPIGRYGPCPQRLHEEFQGAISRIRAGSQWREKPEEFRARQTIYSHFAQRRDVGMLAGPMEGVVVETARRGQAGMSLISLGSAVARAHREAAGMVVEPEVLAVQEEAAAQKKQKKGPRKPG